MLYDVHSTEHVLQHPELLPLVGTTAQSYAHRFCKYRIFGYTLYFAMSLLLNFRSTVAGRAGIRGWPALLSTGNIPKSMEGDPKKQ